MSSLLSNLLYKQGARECSYPQIPGKRNKYMSETKKPQTEEEKRNNRFSFIVGIFIGLAIIILFVLLFH